ncbi:MerR family transcriptional regulator [Thiolinea disciformis]|uniref:MerR family transcriptional regulator n=1 Tax=Thiolinea disciformis TaxID=125614 RepID=UPI00035C4AE6|nr:MerR family transcriptional regulator [Thiolinea disciformis]
MQETPLPSSELPPIPSKRYFTIGEVSDLCGVKSHVLRYWEQEFPSLNPMKRRGNRRYYQREDVLLIRQIRSLLYDEGYTINGARQKILGVESLETTAAPTDLSSFIAEIVMQLEDTLTTLKA